MKWGTVGRKLLHFATLWPIQSIRCLYVCLVLCVCPLAFRPTPPLPCPFLSVFIRVCPFLSVSVRFFIFMFVSVRFGQFLSVSV